MLFSNLIESALETANRILFPILAGLAISYTITLISAKFSSILIAPIMLFLLSIIGGLGVLYGIFSIFVVVPAGCAVAHLSVYLIGLRKLRPDSILRSRFFFIGYGLYFLFASTFAYFSVDILKFHSRNRLDVEHSDQQFERISTLSIYLPSGYTYQRSRSDQHVVAPYATDGCLIPCARILAESDVESIVLHLPPGNGQDARSRRTSSYRYTLADRDGCRRQDGRPAEWLLRDHCVRLASVSYAPPQGFYADIQRSTDGDLLVTTSEVALHLRYAADGGVVDVATFRSGVSEATEFLKALRYPFDIGYAFSDSDPNRLTFGDESPTRAGVVSPMYGLLEYLIAQAG